METIFSSRLTHNQPMVPANSHAEDGIGNTPAVCSSGAPCTTASRPSPARSAPGSPGPHQWVHAGQEFTTLLLGCQCALLRCHHFSVSTAQQQHMLTMQKRGCDIQAVQ